MAACRATGGAGARPGGLPSVSGRPGRLPSVAGRPRAPPAGAGPPGAGGRGAGSTPDWDVGDYGPGAGGAAPQGGSWQDPGKIGTYYTKRRRHATDALGEIKEDLYDDLEPLPGWDTAGQRRFAVQVVARELGLGEAEVERQLRTLETLVPDLSSKLNTMKVADLARLAGKAKDVAGRMVELRTLFPAADISRLVAGRPMLLLEDLADVEERVRLVRGYMASPSFSPADLDRWLERNPLLFLEPSQVKNALEEVRRLFGGDDAPYQLLKNPNLVLNLQTRDDMIPYDNGSLKQLQETMRQGPDAAPDGW